MEKVLIFVLILFFTSLTVFLGGSGFGFAEDKQKTLLYTGIVQEVDGKEKTIVASKGNKTLGMLFQANNTIFKNISGLQDLKPGDKVAVEYDARKGQTFAVSIAKEK